MNESIIKDKVKVIIIVLNLKVKRNLLVEENNTVMIYAIELHELVLTLSIAEQYIQHRTSLIIFMNNQAAIISLMKSRTQSKQYILHHIA